MNAAQLRTIATFFPKVLTSIGNVIMPTIIRVETKAAICVIPAPLFSKAAASGKATNPGMSVIDPSIAAIKIPAMPEFDPSKLVIV